MAKKKKLVKKGKWWFRLLKRLMTSRYKQPEFMTMKTQPP